MLNELYTLERSLTRFSVPVEQAHPWVKRLGRSNILIAGIDPSGAVASIEQLDKENAVKLFKIQESNHSNFPAVNWPAPIWTLDLQSLAVQTWLSCPEEDVGRRVELLRSVCAAAPEAPGQEKAFSHMLDFIRELALRFAAAAEPDFVAFPTLIQRLTHTKPSEWVRSLSNAALQAAEEDGAPMLAVIEELLAGTFDRKRGEIKGSKVPILFDLADCTSPTFRYRVASPKMGAYFNATLNQTEVSGTRNGRCALTGSEMVLETEKMPSPRLPVLGDTVLMSMNPDTPCQTRYGRTGSAIFPLGKSTAASLNSALLHLTAPGREGKNWKPIPGTARKKPNLLVVYLESTPELDADIAELFAGGDESDGLYETVCANVCDALGGLGKARQSPLLHLFVLNKIDPGRVQVELSDTFTAEQVVRGSEDWREGARNRPPMPLKNDEHVPSPPEVARCLQMMWERGGASYSDAPGCRLADLLDLLIAGRPGAAASAKALLRLTLDRSLDLLLAVGHAAHRGGREAWKKLSREAGSHPVVAASVLGITLNKLGYRKGSYMREPAFLIGRFLSLIDTLHAEYSKTVRDDLPPQLLGNALIPTAIGNPSKGIARTNQRLRVYQAWARGRSGTGLARWSCAEMGKIANELESQLPDRRLERARAGSIAARIHRQGREERRQRNHGRSKTIMETRNNEQLVRATGLLVIEVVNSNPNGDPDNESEPRTRVGERGEISSVSFKRKLRDLVEQKDGPVWQDVSARFHPPLEPDGFDILEKRGRDRKKIETEIKDGSFVQHYWDARLFGNTFLEEGSSTSIKTGVVQFGMGISVSPVEVQRHTLTNKSGVQEGKDRGMAPLGYRVVQHGVYSMPFFVNPTAAHKSGCTRRDLELMLRAIPYAYTHTASFVRPDVRLRHAWYVEHKSRLGSCSDSSLIDALTPSKKGDPAAPSQSWSDYEVPSGLPEALLNRVASCIDLVDHEWKTASA